MTRRIIAAFAVALSTTGPTLADHWNQTADPQVVQALNEAGLYGGYCQQGYAEACQMTQAVQQHGVQMLNAGYECQVNGNAQACQNYTMALRQLEHTYASAQQALMQGQHQQPVYDGNSHAQRMQEIHDWGQQRLEWGRQQSEMMDRSHERFMQTLRD